MNYSKRTLEADLNRQVNTKPIIVLTGMRRSGKTTLLNKIFEDIESDNKVFLDMDNIINQRIFSETNFDNIWNNLAGYKISPDKKSYIFIDEIQSAPMAVKAVKYLYDHYRVKFFITGSSSFYLKNLFPESLSGRKITYELYPLAFREFLQFRKQDRTYYENPVEKEKNKSEVRYELYKKYYEEYLIYGGFPQIVLESNKEQKRLLLKDIYSSYFQKDVKMLADFTDIRPLQELILLLMQRTGSKLNITKLSSELGLSRPTVYSYLSFLEGTYFISLVHPFSRNPDREISGAKKVYICDNGFLTSFARIDEGNLLENAVYWNLRKYGKINFFEERYSGKEIDFVLPEIHTAFEVKNRGTTSDYSALLKKATKLKLKKYFIISRKYSNDKGILSAMEL